MKNLFKIIALASIVLIYSCGGSDDEGPTVIPTPNFTQDRQVVEPGDIVTFTNTSTDGETFSWNFGDNTTAVATQNASHTFNSVGTFTVTLTVTSSSGDVATSTSTVLVGNRFTVALAVTAISFVNDNNEAWDPDGSGPELLFGFFPVGQDIFNPFQLGDDFTSNDLPRSGTIDTPSQVMLTDANWNFVYIDNDEPFTDANVSDFMASFTINPVTIASEIDYQTGEGQFEFQADGYGFIIAFDIR
ncbi:PKD domain-containing protein [Roseivirga sp. E12]|uniref:PKD domain-containing protein n=1 Tax=Roseivirga sp. E12 TaxID=2819237 RepID=UPI001ABCC268|nr:PKD domain-containing protein [Roseivirga sp. E12]MBO3698632.1 PKD domain-containing protein [Roseivirga sp. E12]